MLNSLVTDGFNFTQNPLKSDDIATETYINITNSPFFFLTHNEPIALNPKSYAKGCKY